MISISLWVVRTITRGYRLQFTVMPPFLTHVIHCLAQGESGQVLQEEVSFAVSSTDISWSPNEGESGIFPILDLLALTSLTYISGKIRFERRIFPHSQRVGFPLPRRQRFWDCNCDAECMPFSVICLGHLDLREVQFWVAMFGLDPVGHGVCRVQGTPECFSVPCHWQAPSFLTQGELIGTILSRNVIIIDPSSTGCVYEG